MNIEASQIPLFCRGELEELGEGGCGMKHHSPGECVLSKNCTEQKAEKW